MLISTRYLLKNIFTVTVFVALTLTAVIWLTQSLRFLELIAASDAPPGLFLKLVALSLPRFLEIVLPVSLVVGILFSYHKLITDNELIVMRACGMDQRRLARPALMVAGVLSLLLLLMTTWLSPIALRHMQSLRQVIKAEYSALMLREGVFNTFGSDLTVYLRDRQGGELRGMVIHDTRDRSSPPVTITAKKGAMAMIDGHPSIVVYEGMRQQFDSKTDSVSKLHFDRYIIDLRAFAEDVRVRWREASERTFFELLRPDQSDRFDAAHTKRFFIEANNRLLSPLNAIGFALVSLCCLLLGSYERRGYARKILLAIILVTALQVTSIGVASLARVHPQALPLLYLVTLGPIVLGYYFLGFSGEMRLRSLMRALRLGRA